MDSRRGSKTYALAMKFDRSRVVFQKASERLKDPKAKGWFASEPGNAVTPGYGMTKNDAFVDFIEEYWCLTGTFPRGYPN